MNKLFQCKNCDRNCVIIIPIEPEEKYEDYFAQ